MAVNDRPSEIPSQAHTGIADPQNIVKTVENVAESSARSAASNVLEGYAAGKQSTDFEIFSKIMTYLLDAMHKQHWWVKYSNTAMAIVSGLVVMAGWLITTGVGLPRWALIVVGVILFLGSVLGVHTVPDGITEPILKKIMNMPNSPLNVETADKSTK